MECLELACLASVEGRNDEISDHRERRHLVDRATRSDQRARRVESLLRGRKIVDYPREPGIRQRCDAVVHAVILTDGSATSAGPGARRWIDVVGYGCRLAKSAR